LTIITYNGTVMQKIETTTNTECEYIGYIWKITSYNQDSLQYQCLNGN